MSVTNLTVYHEVTHEACDFMRRIRWRNEFFTQSVYLHVLITGIFNAVIFPFSTIFNGAFILCVFLNRTLRRQKSVLLLAFLAITDVLMGAVIQPMFVVSALCRITRACEFSQEIASAVCFLVAICSYSSFFHTSLIACDRYVAIKHALRYRVIVTTNKLRIGTVMAWILSVFMACMFNFFSELQKVVMFVLLIVLAVDVYFYVIICLESRRISLETCNTNSVFTPDQKANSLNRKREFKAAKTTALIFGCLFLCYGPSFLSQVTSIFIVPMNSSNVSVWLCVFLWTRTLMMVNSLCNAFIYRDCVPGLRKNIFGVFKTRRFTTTIPQLRDTRRPMQMFNRVEPNRVDDGIQKITRKPSHISNIENEEQNRFEDSRRAMNAENLHVVDAETKMNNFKGKIAKTCSNTKKMYENEGFVSTKL